MAPAIDTELNALLKEVINQHFAESMRRVPAVYRQHFTSPTSVVKRHWRHRKDIPSDFVSLPRHLWVGGKQWVSRLRPGKKLDPDYDLVVPPANPLSGKERELHRVLYEQLLQLPLLEQRLFEALGEQSDSVTECQKLLPHLSPSQQEEVSAFLRNKLQNMTISREGGRDMLAFLMIGLIGKTAGTPVVFGSAIATGGALAQSLYLAHQSWWGALWASWTGVPAWVTVGGGVVGVVASVAVAPLLSPFAELAMNRLRGERYLRALVQDVRDNSLRAGRDGLDLAGLMAGYAQVAPDLLVMLRHFVR